jgi:predicted RNase H-like nuclease (RuvC/YqgF family)
MIKTIWYYLFKQKEKNMPITNENVVAAAGKLQEQVVAHKDRITHLSERVSSLTDELYMLKNEISGFKAGVARDLQQILTRIDDK